MRTKRLFWASVVVFAGLISIIGLVPNKWLVRYAYEYGGSNEEYTQLAADMGSPRAQFDLSSLPSTDATTAMNLLEKASAQAYAPAQNNLGILYARQGKYKEAISQLKEADIPEGWNNMGVALLEQNLFPDNNSQNIAIDWLNKAKDEGNSDAIKNLSALGEATSIFELARKGDPKAQFYMGWKDYQQGRVKEASNWYMRAFQNGHTEAGYNLYLLMISNFSVYADMSKYSNRHPSLGVSVGSFIFDAKLIELTIDQKDWLTGEHLKVDNNKNTRPAEVPQELTRMCHLNPTLQIQYSNIAKLPRKAHTVLSFGYYLDI